MIRHYISEENEGYSFGSTSSEGGEIEYYINGQKVSESDFWLKREEIDTNTLKYLETQISNLNDRRNILMDTISYYRRKYFESI